MLVCLRQSTRSAQRVTSNLQVSRIISKASNTLIIPLYYPVLLHQINPQTLHDQDLIKLWDGKQMRQYLLPIYYQTFGSYFYVFLLCHAMLVDVDWVSEIHDRCEIVKLMVYLRWQLKYTSGWIEAPGYSSDCLFFLWTAIQAQRDHEIIHTRNFRVQPQAIMGSGIVE